MKRFIIALAVMAFIFIAVFTQAAGRLSEARKEISLLKQQLAHAQTFVPVERDTIRDTVEVATSPVIMAELKSLRRQHVIDERLISDLGLKLKQLEAVQTTVTETRDTAGAAFDHSCNTFTYQDEWSSLRFSLADSTFYYNIRDSLATVVFQEYKHRFLWWRWGVKGYKVKVVNFNPHSTIIYNTYVRPEK